MRSDRLLDVLAGLLAVLGLALVLVPVSVTYDVALPTGPGRFTAACGPPVRAAFGEGIEPGVELPEATGPLPEGVGPDTITAVATDAAVNACRGTSTVYLLLGLACLAGAGGWAAWRRHRANAPRREARQAAWRAANPLGEATDAGAADEVDWDHHDETFDVARDGDFEGGLLGEDTPALPDAVPGPDPEPGAGPDGGTDPEPHPESGPRDAADGAPQA